MNNIELEIGKEYFIWTGRTFSVGTPDKVTPKWVHIQGGYRTATKWILREKITSASLYGSRIVLTSQMYDH